MPGATPSQTVGPYFAIGLPWERRARSPTPDGVRIAGTRARRRRRAGPRRAGRDLAGRPARALRALRPTDDDGALVTVARAAPAPYIAVHVFARGLLRHLHHADLLRTTRRRTTRCWRASRPTGATRCCAAARPTMATASTSASRATARPSSSTSDAVRRRSTRAAASPRRSATRRGCRRCSTSRRRCARARRALIPTRGRAIEPRAAPASTPRSARATHASPVVPLARRCASADDAHAHHGATSQDILDTAMMLVAQRALEPLLARRRARPPTPPRRSPSAHRDDADASAARCCSTALPTTFGLQGRRLDDRRSTRRARRAARGAPLAVQLGGPVGTRDPAVARARGRASSGSPTPVLPWHTDRAAPGALAAALGVLAGALAKVARDVTLLARPRSRGARGRAPRRLVGDGAQAQPGRRGLRARLRARACPGWWRRCSPRWSRSTSAPPAPGRPSGGR